MNKKFFLVIAFSIVLYLGSAGVSYSVFKKSSTSSTIVSPTSPQQTGGFKIDTSAPKTEACPLNGAKFTKAEKGIWEQRRPLGVMIENHADSRPQSGLSKADIVYEAVAEGGITRFLSIFYCGAVAEDMVVGPVRSARTYYLDFVSEYGDYPLYAHVGGANVPGPANALGQIGDYGWLRMGNDMNQFSLGFPTYWRDYERVGHEVATEHTMYSSTEKLWDVAKSRDLTNVDSSGNKWDKNFRSWKFKDDAQLSDRGSVEKVSFEFWQNQPGYGVSWEYNKENNVYSRFNGGQPHVDLDNNEQIKAKSIVILSMKEKGPIDDLKHMLYTTTGEGKMWLFQDGQVAEGTWKKSKRQERTIFQDAKGKEISLNKGPIWIEILPASQKVSY